MENANSSGLARTKSDKLVESVVSALKSQSSGDSIGVADGGGGSSLTRKSSRRTMAASPSRGGGGSTHIRKTSSGVALSRASSSMDFSFSFTGFTLPPDEISNSKPFSDDDDIPEDIEAGIHKPKFQAEPTLPIYLKGTSKLHLSMKLNATNRTYMASNIVYGQVQSCR